MIWTKSEQELRNFRNLTNQKHQSIKFDFKFSKHKVKFVDTLVYKDKKNRLFQEFNKPKTPVHQV